MQETSLAYVLSTPAGLPPADGWPLLCFLHGYGEAAPMAIEPALTLHGPLASQAAPVARTSFVVLAPQLPDRGILWADVACGVQEAVRHTRTHHRIDRSRQYLTGFSRGGDGAFALALAQPDWAALWAVDPPRVPRDIPDRPVWLSAGAASRPAAPEFIERLRLESFQGGTPGQRVYVDGGLDHVGTARAAYQDERIYQWLLSHCTPAVPTV